MIKLTAFFFLFLTVVCCANVGRQGETDPQNPSNPFVRYRYGERNDDVSDRGWPQRRDYDRRYQRQRARDQDQRYSYITTAIARWLAGDEEYEPYEEVPYWSRYESRIEYPWEAFQFPFNY